MFNIIKNLFKSKVESFVLGEPFPWKEYAQKNVDSIRPVLNVEGFDVVICFSNISKQEMEAFCDKKLVVSVKEILGIPFIVFDFDGVLKVDFALNVMKMNVEYRDLWLSMDKDDYDIRVFLVEATTTNLVAIRHCPFSDMNYIRRICSSQVPLDMKKIDSMIMLQQQIYDVNSLMQLADKQYKIETISI